MEKDLGSLISVSLDKEVCSGDKFEGYEQSGSVNDGGDSFDAGANEVAKKMEVTQLATPTLRKDRSRLDKPPLNLSSLPEALVILILSNLNVKDVCVCSIVCKRFASLVTQTQTVRLTCPVRKINIMHGIIKPSTYPDLNFITFLEKLGNLKSISLEVTCPRDTPQSSVIWKAKCETKRGIIDSFVCQLLENMTRNQGNQEDPIFGTRSFMLRCITYGLRVFVRCFDCVNLLCILVQRICSLRGVTIMDSEKQGKVILEGEQLVLWRNILVRQRPLDLCFMKIPFIGFQPTWGLPEWGHIHTLQGMHGLRLQITVELKEDVDDRYITYELGF